VGAAETLYALELALARRDVDAIPGGYDAVLDEAFVEFGSSGRAWTRDEIIELLERDSLTDAVSIAAFEAVEIRSGVFLVLYETNSTDPRDGRRLRRRRSSIWLRRGDRFRLRFHQGTPVPDRPD
jgi:ribonuclease HI